MAESMTIKQIAELCGVGEQTVRDWIKAGTATGSAAPEIVSASLKLSEAGHGRPAMLDLPETLAIIRAGGNNTLADLLADNARRKPAITLDEPAPATDPLAVRWIVGERAVKAGIATPAEARAFMGLPALLSLPESTMPHAQPYRGHHGYLQPVSYERGRNTLMVSVASAFPVSAATLEKYLGASRMTFLRWGERLGSRPPWTREQAIEIWSAIHRKRLPE
ncbi:MAG TPA: helix-turn-helix domain-containing protein [Coriobacteriia bacterium]|nr:helix-turn-helix domain-containing protein [Coriobacteriia bacterium]